MCCGGGGGFLLQITRYCFRPFACFLAIIEDRLALDSTFDFNIEVNHPFLFYVQTKNGVVFLIGRVQAL